MKPLLLIVISGVIAATPPQADHAPSCDKQTCPAAPAPCAPPAPPPPPPIVWVEKTVTMYRPEIRPRDFKDTVDQLELRRVTSVEKYPSPELVPIPQIKKMCIPRLVPREVVTEVCRTRMVMETVIDECTGCPKTVGKAVPEVKKVVQTVYDVETVEQEVPVTTYDLRIQEKERTLARFVGETKPMNIVRRSYTLQLVPYQVKVKIPVCAEAAPPPVQAK